MSHTRYLKALFNDLCSGWKPFELFWLAAFLAAQIWAYWQQPDSWVSMVAGISGIICFRHHLRGAGEQRQNH